MRNAFPCGPMGGNSLAIGASLLDLPHDPFAGPFRHPRDLEILARISEVEKAEADLLVAQREADATFERGEDCTAAEARQESLCDVSAAAFERLRLSPPGTIAGLVLKVRLYVRCSWMGEPEYQDSIVADCELLAREGAIR